MLPSMRRGQYRPPAHCFFDLRVIINKNKGNCLTASRWLRDGLLPQKLTFRTEVKDIAAEPATTQLAGIVPETRLYQKRLFDKDALCLPETSSKNKNPD